MYGTGFGQSADGRYTDIRESSLGESVRSIDNRTKRSRSTRADIQSYPCSH